MPTLETWYFSPSWLTACGCVCQPLGSKRTHLVCVVLSRWLTILKGSGNLKSHFSLETILLHTFDCFCFPKGLCWPKSVKGSNFEALFRVGKYLICLHYLSNEIILLNFPFDRHCCCCCSDHLIRRGNWSHFVLSLNNIVFAWRFENLCLKLYCSAILEAKMHKFMSHLN